MEKSAVHRIVLHSRQGQLISVFEVDRDSFSLTNKALETLVEVVAEATAVLLDFVLLINQNIIRRRPEGDDRIQRLDGLQSIVHRWIIFPERLIQPTVILLNLPPELFLELMQLIFRSLLIVFGPLGLQFHFFEFEFVEFSLVAQLLPHPLDLVFYFLQVLISLFPFWVDLFFAFNEIPRDIGVEGLLDFVVVDFGGAGGLHLPLLDEVLLGWRGRTGRGRLVSHWRHVDQLLLFGVLFLEGLAVPFVDEACLLLGVLLLAVVVVLLALLVEDVLLELLLLLVLLPLDLLLLLPLPALGLLHLLPEDPLHLELLPLPGLHSGYLRLSSAWSVFSSCSRFRPPCLYTSCRSSWCCCGDGGA